MLYDNPRLRNYMPKVHETPRLLMADAYTTGSDLFQSPKAKQKSVYYITFRKELITINKTLYKKGDNRMLFSGLQRIIHRLFVKPVTHEEIDETKRFLADKKITNKGLARYQFPEAMWRTVVDEYGGIPPIRITAMPEGSVVYPNEPVVEIESLVPELPIFGELAAWFESKLLHVWAPSERMTQDRHWYDKLRDMVRMVEPDLTDEQVNFYASIMLTDFGDRAGICAMESEDLGMTALYTFPGTDTFCGAYQAWKNSGESPGIAMSVSALAHRNVQAWPKESDAYEAIYNTAENDEILSMVADCYAYRPAVDRDLVRLALRSAKENNGKIVVGRPDSGIAVDEVLYLCRAAVKAGLYTTREINGKTWYFSTYLRFIEGDGMTHEEMWNIMMAMIAEGFVPYSWGLFGQGGGQRNGLKRDNFSAKYALCAIGLDYEPVVKFSDTYGKTTLPGPHKVLRTQEALDSKKTIVFRDEPGEDARVVYFDGCEYEYFREGMHDDFITIKNRSHQQFDTYPLSLTTEENHNYPASDRIIEVRKELLEKYAPSKDSNNY